MKTTVVTAGDPFTTYTISGVTSWSQGVDNSASDAYVISASTALGTTNVISMATGGNVSTVLGDFDVTRSSSGGTVSSTISNTSNTSSSNSLQQLIVAGTSAGDAFTTYTVSGTTNWSEGVDNSASDAYVISASTALGTTNVMSASTAGEVNWPLQPAFLARANAQSNVTGDGTTYTVIFANEIFDQNNDFDGTSTFTAPVTGRYSIYILFGLTGLLIGHTQLNGTIVTSNRTYFTNNNNPYLGSDGTGAFKFCGSMLCDMDAADTAINQITVTGSTKVVGMSASASFAANLTC